MSAKDTAPTCFDVAKFFLAYQDEDAGDTISNLKLQKLCYYAQGFTLAITGKPLFPEKIEAWAHGPVCPALYHEYKAHQAKAIPKPKESLHDICDKFSEEQIGILREVWEAYGQFSAWKLRDMTHEEPPWRNAFHGDPVSTETITQDAMYDYFKTQVA